MPRLASPRTSPYLAGRSRRRRPRGVVRRRPSDRDGMLVARPRRGARHGGSGARAARRRRARARCCCTITRAAMLEPSSADLDVAARLHDDGVGLRDHRQRRPTELYVVVEVPTGDARDRGSIRSTWWTSWAKHGPVARALGQYEDRPSQRDMAAYIADAYNDGGVLLLEAGTGVGKSFAYLVPALAWARANGERTVVTTNTINLQEQLVGKDLPLLRDALAHRRPGADVRAAQGMAELSLPRPAGAGGRRAALAARAGQATTSWRRLRRVGRPHRRRHAGRPAGRAEQRGVGRGQRGGRSLHPAQVPPLRPLLPVPGPAPGGRGRRRGGEPSPARRRPRGAAGHRTTGRKRRCCRPTGA